jgi:hypothetical protein
MLILALFGFISHFSLVAGDGVDTGSFTDQFDVEQRDDGLPLRRIHHRYLYKRDLHHELFEPRSDLQLDVLLGKLVHANSIKASTNATQAMVYRRSTLLTIMHRTSI